MSRILSLLSKGVTTKGGRNFLGGATGNITDAGIISGGIYGIGSGLGHLFNLPNTWRDEAAADLDVRDINNAEDLTTKYGALPFYKRPFVSKEGLKSKVERDELKEIRVQDYWTQGQGYLDADKIPELTEGMSKQQARNLMGQAVRTTKTARGDADYNKTVTRGLELAAQQYNLPHLVEARAQEQIRYNNTLLQAEKLRQDGLRREEANRLEAEAIRLGASKEAAADRMFMMQMQDKRDQQSFRRDKKQFNAQMVMALTDSLRGLSGAFTSI